MSKDAKTKKTSSAKLKSLLAVAEKIRPRAYSRYSHISVGAALLLSNDQIVAGVNVENASYGVTICAERAAVANAVTCFGSEIKIKAVAVTVKNKSVQLNSAPCGACRQVLMEFADKQCQVIFSDGKTNQIVALADLLPRAFSIERTMEGDGDVDSE